MKTFFLFAILFLSFTNFSTAQNTYQSFDYMKVEAGNHADYLALEKAWKKIHEYNMKRDKITGWELSRIMSPKGESVEYNYVTRISLKEGKQFEEYMESFPMPKDLTSILSPEEIKLVNRTTELRTYVKNEIYSSIEVILPDGFRDAKIHVFNFFDHPEGKRRADHVKVEKEIWMPVHQARADADKMEGWVMAGLMFPFGADQPYHEVTLDMYKDMTQYMADDSFKPYFEKVHAGKDMDELMEQTRASSRLIKGEVRMVIDKTISPATTATKN